MKRTAIYSGLFLLVACAAQPIASEERNEKIFAELLRKGANDSAARFALYFQGADATETQLRLLAQYALQTCNTETALALTEKLPRDSATNQLEMVALALQSIPRPWTKPLLKEKSLPEYSGVREQLTQEVWADEWQTSEVLVNRCEAFPILAEEEARKKAAERALQLFAQEKDRLPSLTFVGLAMDLGYMPNAEEVGRFLEKFRSSASHPYYLRLQALAENQLHVPSKFRSLRQQGAKVQLSSLTLDSQEFQLHAIEIPWTAGGIE